MTRLKNRVQASKTKPAGGGSLSWKPVMAGIIGLAVGYSLVVAAHPGSLFAAQAVRCPSKMVENSGS